MQIEIGNKDRKRNRKKKSIESMPFVFKWNIHSCFTMIYFYKLEEKPGKMYWKTDKNSLNFALKYTITKIPTTTTKIRKIFCRHNIAFGRRYSVAFFPIIFAVCAQNRHKHRPIFSTHANMKRRWKNKFDVHGIKKGTHAMLVKRKK